MKVKDFVREVRKEAAKRDYVGDVQIIDQGLYAVKMWLIITPDMKVQLYYNERTGTTNFALLLHEERIYGRNKRGRSWHRHPVERPWEHDVSPEGAKPVSVAEFLQEVDKVLMEKKLL